MTTEEAYNAAVEAMCRAAEMNHIEDVQWMAKAVKILWERCLQEGAAKDENFFIPDQAVSLANGYNFTRKTLQHMKTKPEIYGSLFKSNVTGGLQ